MLLVILTFAIRAMQGLPIATVFYETKEVILIDRNNRLQEIEYPL